MPTEVQIPTLGESVNEGVIVRWVKADGDTVSTDESLFELETDKANVEIPAPSGGVLRILRQEGETVRVGDTVARIDPSGSARSSVPNTEESGLPSRTPDVASEPTPKADAPLSPAVRRLIEENALAAETIPATGRGGRLTKGDVLSYIEGQSASEPSEAPARPGPSPTGGTPTATPRVPEGDRRVPMTRIRQRIAERLVAAQQTAAILTTFNEIDMSAVLETRSRHKEAFAERHGVRLGFMSFFARACIAALAKQPIVNAQIDGTDIVYRQRVHLGIAVGTERGLVVPVVRNANLMSFAELESEIDRLAKVAQQNRLGIDDLSGGTFTISNGGVYGSLLSTPILNPPQSAILGMHKIEKRPVAIDEQVLIRPMMYIALSYDHRLIDGADAVTFLVRVKEGVEDPTRLLLGI